MTGWLIIETGSPTQLSSGGVASIWAYYQSPNRTLVLRLEDGSCTQFIVCVGCTDIPSKTRFSFDTLSCQQEHEGVLTILDGSTILVQCTAVRLLDERSLNAWLGSNSSP